MQMEKELIDTSKVGAIDLPHSTHGATMPPRIEMSAAAQYDAEMSLSFYQSSFEMSEHYYPSSTAGPSYTLSESYYTCIMMHMYISCSK